MADPIIHPGDTSIIVYKHGPWEGLLVGKRLWSMEVGVLRSDADEDPRMGDDRRGIEAYLQDPM